MLGFRRSRSHQRNETSRSAAAYRYRVEGRKKLLDRYELVTLRENRQGADEQEKLARVLEETSGEGWRLVGISGDDFIFRRRR